MNTKARVIDLLTAAIDQEIRTAENAFVRSHTAKATCNCKHAGEQLGDGVRACTIRACGPTEAEAGTCYDRKAITCCLFVPRGTAEELRRHFRGLSQQELSRRWPALGKLTRILKQAQNLDGDE